MSAIKVGTFKRLWNTMPEVVGSSFMGALGIVMAAVGVFTYYQKDGDNRRYKFEYTVIRDDDPRAARVRTD